MALLVIIDCWCCVLWKTFQEEKLVLFSRREGRSQFKRQRDKAETYLKLRIGSLKDSTAIGPRKRNATQRKRKRNATQTQTQTQTQRKRNANATQGNAGSKRESEK